jgi:hypothetical protein
MQHTSSDSKSIQLTKDTKEPIERNFAHNNSQNIGPLKNERWLCAIRAQAKSKVVAKNNGRVTDRQRRLLTRST